MIIESLLDTDLYKFTMMQVVLHHFPGAEVEYRFKCRTPDVDLTPYIGQIEREISALCGLRFTRRELDYLRSWRFFKSDFVDLLGLFQLDERSAGAEAGVVHQEVDLQAEAADLIDDARDAVRRGKVCGHHPRLHPVRGLQLARQRFQAIAPSRHQDQVVLVGGKEPRVLGAQPGRRSGDQCGSHVRRRSATSALAPPGGRHRAQRLASGASRTTE